MPRKRATDDGELLARVRSLTAQARERAEYQRSQVEPAIALQRGMPPRDLPETPRFIWPPGTRPPAARRP